MTKNLLQILAGLALIVDAFLALISFGFIQSNFSLTAFYWMYQAEMKNVVDEPKDEHEDGSF